ncbi:MAG TPA: cobalt-precorrin 5A hydrolase [Epulopiscium sp.]|nr:cobalt-precorrin 5A hydrolase [Candidatus Epulonipiscium sp.]
MILISATQKGNKIGETLKDVFGELEIITREAVVKDSLQKVTQEAMEKHKTIIFVSSTGIAVRAIGPWVKDKTKDPAVIVIDAQAKYVISLLSGHIGGANQITNEIANYLGAMPIITTATDGLELMAPDLISTEYNLEIDSMEKCKEISVHLIQGEAVAFIDEDHLIPMPKGYVGASKETHYRVVVTNKAHLPNATLKLIRKNIVLGIGCRKNIDPEKMRQYILSQLDHLNIHPLAIKEIVSIDIKKEEQCIIELSEHLKVPFKVYSKEQINTVEVEFEGSDFVEQNVGVRGVSEPCVILAGAQIIQGKTKYEGMTLCVGKLPS